MDLDAEYKPIVAAVVIIVGVMPMVVFAWLNARVAADKQTTIDALLASGTGTQQQLLALTDDMHAALTKAADRDLHRICLAGDDGVLVLLRLRHR